MNYSDQFDELIEALRDDRSPAVEAWRLASPEQIMLVLAQRIRGSQGQDPDPEFVRTLRDRVGLVDVRCVGPRRRGLVEVD